MRPLVDQETKHHILDQFARLEIWFRDRKAEGAKRYGWDPNCECHDCGDTGMDPGTNRPCWCEVGKAIGERHERKQNWLNFVPPMHLHSRLSTHPVVEAREVGDHWLKINYPQRRGLFITGPVGTGKTGLAVSVAYELHLQGEGVRFHRTSELLDTLKAGIGTDDPAAQRRANETMDKVLNIGILVLDDLGAQKVTEWSGDRIQTIIDGRHGRKLPTIITTNLTSEDLRRQYGERVLSRIVESCLIAPLPGQDLRMNNIVQFRRTA